MTHLHRILDCISLNKLGCYLHFFIPFVGGAAKVTISLVVCALIMFDCNSFTKIQITLTA